MIRKLIGIFFILLGVYDLLMGLHFYLQYLWGNIAWVQMTNSLIMLLIPFEANILIALPNIVGVIIVSVIILIKRKTEEF